MDYCEIRCPKKTYIPKYRRFLTCQNLIVKVAPGSSGEGFCFKRDPSSNLMHGAFEFTVDVNWKPQPKKVIKVKK